VSDLPEYYSTPGLLKAAGVSRTTFRRHCEQNVGGILKARMKVEGLGIRWHGATARKYLNLCRARTARLAVAK
jgi:ribosomal protein S14